MEFLLLLLLLGAKGGPAPTPGQITTIKARDGSSHRLQFLTVEDKTTGKRLSGWAALSTDTGLRFKQGEQASILGRSYRWHLAHPIAKDRKGFTGGVFI